MEALKNRDTVSREEKYGHGNLREEALACAHSYKTSTNDCRGFVVGLLAFWVSDPEVVKISSQCNKEKINSI